MIPKRFRELWALSEPAPVNLDGGELREALTALVESEAMREKWEHIYDFNAAQRGSWHHGLNCKECDWSDADWIKAAWEKWLGRVKVNSERECPQCGSTGHYNDK